MKKAAVQSDYKLRQYVIEYGVNVTSYTTCINTVAIVRPPTLMPANRSSPSVTTTTTTSAIVTTEKQTTTSDLTERPSFAVMPMVIKEEPIDYEAMSDITIETNTETYDENGANDVLDMARPSNSTASNPIIARRKEKVNAPPVPSLMVAVNDKSLLASSSTSDVDYINAYMQTPSSASDESPSESANSPIQATPSKLSSSSLAPTNTITSSATTNQTPTKTLSPKTRNIKQQQNAIEVPRELRMLKINLKRVSNVIQSDILRPSRTSLGKIKPKTYFEHTKKMVEKGKSKNLNKSIEGKSQRKKLNRLANKQHRKTVASKRPLRQRSSL